MLEIGYYGFSTLVSFILTENQYFVQVARQPRLATSVNTAPTIRHALASKVVITLQSFVILSLTYWIVEEYLNNMYLRQYVGDYFQANGLVIGMLGALLMVGSLSSLMLMRRRHGGAVALEITDSARKIKTPVERNTKTPQTSAKPDTDFHPVVAALKADMADRRMSFGSMLGSTVEQPSKAPAPNAEVSKTSVLDQLAPNRQLPAAGPRPGLMVAPPAQRPPPILQPQQPVGSNVLQPSQPPPPPMPLKITTVITGIMPAQKKKDPNADSEEKPASQ
jgi:hypothetical protein